MGRIFTELQRRKVYQVAAVYAASAWLLVQAGAIVTSTFFAPAWIMQMFVTLLILGFVPAMAIAWAFERTPGGLIRTQAESGSATPLAKPRDAWLPYAVSASLVVIAGWLFLSMEYIDPTNVAGTGSAGPIRPAIDVSKSVAVLPLTNLSPDPERAYFAAGIHEEILGQLAKISSLRVISRTSVMQYRDTTKTIGQIGEELGVGAVVEGSVRYSGNQVRITAQLIRTSDDTHLWSATYERSLDDIFAIQTDVAFSIAEALEAKLSDEEHSKIAKAPTDNLEAYNLFLVTRQRQLANFNRVDWNDPDNYIYLGVRDMERAVALDPSYAVGFAELAFLHGKRMNNFYESFESRERALQMSNSAAEKAIEIAPLTARAYDILARNATNWDYDWEKAETLFQKALGIESEARIYDAYGMFLLQRGMVQEAIAAHQQAAFLDPNPEMVLPLARAQYVAEQYDAALSTLDDYLTLGGLESRYYALKAMILVSTGYAEEAFGLAEAALAPESGRRLGEFVNYIVFVAAKTGHVGLVDRVTQFVYVPPPARKFNWSGTHLFAALGAGDIDAAFEHLFTMIDQKNLIYYAPTVSKDFELLWDDPRFDQVMSRMNLLE